MLVFSHSFANRASAPRSAAGWTVCLGSLVAALDGRWPRARTGTAYYEHYGNEFGTEGIFARNGETAELRFERLLDHPVAEVWDALTRPGRLADWLAETSTVLSEGEPVQLRFATPAGCTVTGTVTRLDAPKVLEYTWTSPGEPDGVVKWQLIGVAASCLLLLTHTVRGHWERGRNTRRLARTPLPPRELALRQGDLALSRPAVARARGQLRQHDLGGKWESL